MPWFIKQVKDEQQTLIVEHGGTTINFSSQVLLAPEHKLGVIILSNTSRVNKVINKIAKSLLDKLINNPDKHTVKYVSEQNQQPETGNSNSSKSRYIAKSGIIEIDKDASKLCDCQTNRKLNLVPLPDGWFGLSPDNKKYRSKITEKVIDGNAFIVLDKSEKQHRIGSRYKHNNDRFNSE